MAHPVGALRRGSGEADNHEAGGLVVETEDVLDSIATTENELSQVSRPGV
jgi:hypothetical protein